MIDAADLGPWSERAELGQPLTGGTVNQVIEARLDGERAVARRSSRAPAALDWELDLLDHLDRHGFVVPVPIRTRDGRRGVGDLTVCRWIDGRAPDGDDDWRAVAAELARLHAVTGPDWPQRPGFLATADLVAAERGGDADLTIIPREIVAELRTAWARLDGRPRSVVHGDPGPTNLRIAAGRVALLDWDESRVDYTDLDLGQVPASPLPAARLALAVDAAHAWEAAIFWSRQPAYARTCVERLRAGAAPPAS